jgi:hypothetical protein
MKRQDIYLTAATVAGIAFLGIVLYRRTTAPLKPPEWVLNLPASKIDLETLEVSTMPAREWLDKYSPDASGNYKNPKTGKYTIVGAMVCRHCGKLIPTLPSFPKTAMTPEERTLFLYQVEVLYRCPYCKKSPFEPSPLRHRAIPPPSQAAAPAPS